MQVRDRHNARADSVPKFPGIRQTKRATGAPHQKEPLLREARGACSLSMDRAAAIRVDRRNGPRGGENGVSHGHAARADDENPDRRERSGSQLGPSLRLLQVWIGFQLPRAGIRIQPFPSPRSRSKLLPACRLEPGSPRVPSRRGASRFPAPWSSSRSVGSVRRR